jgi:hypothetical protein
MLLTHLHTREVQFPCGAVPGRRAEGRIGESLEKGGAAGITPPELKGPRRDTWEVHQRQIQGRKRSGRMRPIAGGDSSVTL